jgi:hypothetical protein
VSPQYARKVDEIPVPQKKILEFEKYVAISLRISVVGERQVF